MLLMRVPLGELLHQAAMEQIPALEYMLLGTHELLQLRPIVLGG
jgi:hypothetical protein